MPQELSARQVEQALATLDGWAVEDGALVKTYTFADFRTAMGALVRIGFEAETMNHHPELRNVYDTVDVRLTTHDAGDRITELDVQLARRIDAALFG